MVEKKIARAAEVEQKVQIYRHVTGVSGWISNRNYTTCTDKTYHDFRLSYGLMPFLHQTRKAEGESQTT